MFRRIEFGALIVQILHLFFKKLLARLKQFSNLLPISAFLVMRSRIGFSVPVYQKGAIALNTSWFFLCDRIYSIDKDYFPVSVTRQLNLQLNQKFQKVTAAIAIKLAR